MDKNDLLNTHLEKLCAYFVEKHCIDIPTLDRKETEVDQHETEVDVRGDLRFNVDDTTKPFYVPGTEIEISVPFVGDSEAFTIRPTSYSFSPPRGNVGNNVLIIRITGIDLETDKARQDIDNQLDRIDNYLTSLRGSMEMLNNELDSIARQCITKRRDKLIAECKYWDGPKKLTETINQILRYSSWRDTKVAVTIFNRNKNFTNVLDTIKSTTNDHPNCKQELDQPSESSFRFIFSHRDDIDRELTLTIVAFDVPNESE